MQIIHKYQGVKGFGRLYEYAYKHNHMITKEAQERERILLFWRKHGLEATQSAFKAKRSVLFAWWKIYKDLDYRTESLNPKTQARKTQQKRNIDYRLLAEIRRLRLEFCPNMGKAKVKKNLDIFCKLNNIQTISESTIGRVIKDKKIYHHRQKLTFLGKPKIIKKSKKLRKPKEFIAETPGDLIEIDTVVKFVWKVKRYIITAVDIKTRYSFAYAYDRAGSFNARDFYQKLEVAFPYKIKAIQTDNGSEFHKYFAEYLKEQNITHYYNYPGKPYRNGQVEKYNRTLQEEFIDQNEFLLTDTREFNQKLMDWLLWYNTERYHWSLDLTSPVNFLINNSLLSKMRWTDTLACFFMAKIVKYPDKISEKHEKY